MKRDISIAEKDSGFDTLNISISLVLREREKERERDCELINEYSYTLTFEKPKNPLDFFTMSCLVIASSFSATRSK